MMILNYMTSVCSNKNLNGITLTCNGISLTNGQTSTSLPFYVTSNIIYVSTLDPTLVGTFTILMTYTLTDLAITE